MSPLENKGMILLMIGMLVMVLGATLFPTVAGTVAHTVADDVAVTTEFIDNFSSAASLLNLVPITYAISILLLGMGAIGLGGYSQAQDGSDVKLVVIGVLFVVVGVVLVPIIGQTTSAGLDQLVCLASHATDPCGANMVKLEVRFASAAGLMKLLPLLYSAGIIIGGIGAAGLGGYRAYQNTQN